MRSREERETQTGGRGGREVAEQWRNATDVASERMQEKRNWAYNSVMGEISRARWRDDTGERERE